ncbi:cobalamin B12-binding domain-containing protein [Salisediminibacterium selenitireducens]|uniref:Cobalamin B12-binding domain protein n=1 Tax=Bacillus selenitireducens (strain ATCC 700615 / DSM 15326 / MLS10) TaxID=439292 RepID=D6XYN3_BACIE|nr:cobalamin-dependent protein [Salisediminibacterium selenitireducens]ADH98191.1 cobalamin B12-binding domain protein [[Bacillus] selenitireducens MLS10]
MKGSEAFTRILLAGNEELAVEQALSYAEQYGKHRLYEEVITPAMYEIGQMWEENRITVADEHLATGISDFVLTVVDERNKEQAKNGRTVLLFGVEKEEHYLGLKMVASLFRDKGWTTRYLGPNLPVESAIAAMNKWSPDVIGVSASMANRIPDVLSYLEQLNEQQPHELKVLIGGRFADTVADKVTGFPVEVLQSLTELAHWLDRYEDVKADAPV